MTISLPLPTTDPKKDPDEVEISIAGKKWRGFGDFELVLSADEFMTFGFSAPYEADRAEFRDTFRPLSFKPTEVLIGGARVLNGTMVDVVPDTSSEAKRVNVSGYSKPGVLCDSDVPASMLPFESNGLTLEEMAKAICGAFGLTSKFAEGASAGPAFHRVKVPHRKRTRLLGIRRDVNVGGNAHQFLATLAQQRGLVISDDDDGNVVFQKSASVGSPVARLRQGVPPVVGVEPAFSPQNYFQELTGFAPARKGVKGSKYTAVNARLAGVVRSSVFQLDDVERGDVQVAVRARMGRMFASVFSVSVKAPTWRDPKGRLWKPNTTLKIVAPDSMIYTETEFLIRRVTLSKTDSAKTATLSLALPGVFSGDIPTKLPWD